MDIRPVLLRISLQKERLILWQIKGSDTVVTGRQTQYAFFAKLVEYILVRKFEVIRFRGFHEFPDHTVPSHQFEVHYQEAGIDVLRRGAAYRFQVLHLKIHRAVGRLPSAAWNIITGSMGGFESRTALFIWKNWYPSAGFSEAGYGNMKDEAEDMAGRLAGFILKQVP